MTDFRRTGLLFEKWICREIKSLLCPSLFFDPCRYLLMLMILLHIGNNLLNSNGENGKSSVRDSPDGQGLYAWFWWQLPDWPCRLLLTSLSFASTRRPTVLWSRFAVTLHAFVAVRETPQRLAANEPHRVRCSSPAARASPVLISSIPGSTAPASHDVDLQLDNEARLVFDLEFSLLDLYWWHFSTAVNWQSIAAESYLIIFLFIPSFILKITLYLQIQAARRVSYCSQWRPISASS